MQSFSLPINYLRQYVFCPRIPFYRLTGNITPPMPLWVTLGKKYHIDREKLLKKRFFKTLEKEFVIQEVIYSQKVEGKNLQLHGTIDALVITPNSYIPIEFKMSAKKPMPNHLIQLAGYALCLEEMFYKKISHGYLISEKRAKIFRINIDEELRQKVYNTLANIIQDVESGLKPDSNAKPSKCAQCEFINFCNDREVE